MKKFLLLLLTFISPNVFAQNDYFKIKEGSFTHVAGAVMDDAKEHTDADDKPMAVFKISTENINNEERQKLYFTGNRVTEISDKVYKTGQVWIYLTAEDSEYLEIRHPDYGSTRFYFPESLCEFCTYEMVLQYIDPTPMMETGNLSISSEPDGADIYIDGKLYGKTNDVITDLKEGNQSMQLEKDGYSTLTKTIVINKGETLKLNETLQTLSSQRTYLIVKADQDDARIYIDDELVGMGEGTKAVIIGTTHTYKIQCNLYHDETGSVTVKGKETIEKQLRPSFGYIDISTSPEQGANVYVDDEYAGISPLRTDKLQSGAHKVMVMKNMYKMTEQSFLVVDGQTTMANLNMQPNFVNVTVNTDMSSDIYVDEDYKSKGNWTGRLSEGIHVFEARKANYAPSRKEVELVLGADKNISLEAPKPITGALDVNSMPIEANIYIDGKSYGTTPNMINNLLIGIHELRLEKEGYVTLTKSINIRENETYNLNENLQKKNTAEELYNIGIDYYDKKDYVKAVEYFRKAAEQGHARAQFYLGYCYNAGQGVAKDYAEAVKWYRKAAEQGDAWAQNNLGNCYYNGEGVAKDYAEAAKWYRKAAEQGHAKAQYNLGLCYQYGQGVAKDLTKAKEWYQKAADNGNENAKIKLKELSGTQQTNSISKIKVKGGSFKKINGFVMLDKSDHLDMDNAPMALIKISAENISAEQMREFTFSGNRMTDFDVQFNLGEIHLYLSTTATFIEISHPDYGKTEYWLPEILCDYCGYEMTIVGE